MDYSREIAERAWKIPTFKLAFDNPTTWASGYRMPVYNNNRRFFFNTEDRRLIVDAFCEEIEKIKYSDLMVIAGTSTAGIPWGALVADLFGTDFIYVRDKPKDHGLRNQIEGIDSESSLEGRKVILIEDLVSTGGSSIKAIQAIRDAKGDCRHCISIFNYELDGVSQSFDNLNPSCSLGYLLNYVTLIEVSKEENKISKEQEKMLEEWKSDPFN